MRFAFEDCVLDTSRRELRRGAESVDLEPQVFDLLEFLIRTRDRVASRDDLIEAVWNGRIVSESTLSSRINAARVAIGDDGTAQRLIRTLPRKGIRFVGQVREESETPAAVPVPATRSQQDTSPAFDGPSIAVLPFTNMSGDPESDYFADGITEEIITALAHCSGLLVIARTSSFIYKGRAIDVRQVGRELGVGYVLEGSVRRRDDRLRITVQLIEATAGTHLWASRFDGSLSEVFELQDRIAANAAATIEPKLRFAEAEGARRKPPGDMRAYDLWLRALSHAWEFTPDSIKAALRCLEQALEIDPAYALAMSTAAYYRAQSVFQGWAEQPEAERAVAVKLAWQAIGLAGNDANVLWQGAFTVWSMEQDGLKALELARRALQVNPNSTIALAVAGWIEAVTGDPEGGRRKIEQALRLIPRHPRAWLMSTAMAVSYIASGQYHDAVSWAEKATVENRRFAPALRFLAVALVKVGQIDRARQIVREMLQAEPTLTLARLRTRVPFVERPILKVCSDALRTAGLPD
ncbi:MAG TPA: winged helix-turn-helix domain-containing protein [Vineibacter sp.]|nr:winged helix-turn-helix domain-containing protein [Vineibacter sp.]